MKLLISEKPSVAMAISKVLGVTSRRDGYMEGNEYLISWCVGHLVELAPADTYDARYSKWNREDLPIIPQDWQYQVLPATKKQFQVLSTLMQDQRVDGLICATDAGREGELIFRLVYHLCGCVKPVERLWISSMEESAIRKGMDNLQSDSAFDNLYAAALCRAKADWLIGINATRLFSVLHNRTLNVGRVMTPTLALLVERETAIADFKKEKFYTVDLTFPGFHAASERFSSKTDAEKLRSACVGKPVTVQKVETQEKKEYPPKLYDLTTLQREANRIFSYTAQQTLDYLQSLYERHLLTYPRTDSRYLTDEMDEELPALCKSVAELLPFARDQPVTVEVGRVLDMPLSRPWKQAAPIWTRCRRANGIFSIWQRYVCSVPWVSRTSIRTPSLHWIAEAFFLPPKVRQMFLRDGRHLKSLFRRREKRKLLLLVQRCLP